MIEFDGTIIVQIINFIVLMFFLNQILYKPILKGITERRNFLETGKQKIQFQLSEIERMQKEYKDKLNQAIKSSQVFLNDSINQAEKEKANILNKIISDCEQQFKEIQEDLEKQKKELRKTLEENVENLSESIIKKLLGNLSSV